MELQISRGKTSADPSYIRVINKETKETMLEMSLSDWSRMIANVGNYKFNHVKSIIISQ